MLPDIFLVKAVETSVPLPMPSMLIFDGYDAPTRTAPPCSGWGCIDAATPGPVTGLFVQGFDDFSDFEPAIRAFLPVGPPLVAHRPLMEQLVSKLSGGQLIEVGFSQWNQTPVPEVDRYSRPPKLGAIYVTSTCGGAFDRRGNRIPRCRQCGRMLWVDWKSENKKKQYAVDSSRWDGSDVFVMEGTLQQDGLVVTDRALTAFAEFGLTNLVLKRLNWTQ